MNREFPKGEPFELVLATTWGIPRGLPLGNPQDNPWGNPKAMIASLGKPQGNTSNPFHL